MIKINIFWKIKNCPYGGGNQFLKVLKKYFVEREVYEENPNFADVILVNSKDNLREAIVLKEKHFKTCIHRIDGIFSIYRGKHEKHNDLKVYDFAKIYADGVIFQSNWSKTESKKNGMGDKKFEVVILNCSDGNIFYKEQNICESKKIKLITSTWSENPKKGFGIYEFLDFNLDFDKYEYIFVGRSPINFRNIKMVGAMSSDRLSSYLRKSNVFITATQDDACSNSLIEALSCGVPSVVLNSGGSPEILKSGGEIFDSTNDVMDKIKMVSDNLGYYRSRINVNGISCVGKKYLDFITKVYNEK